MPHYMMLRRKREKNNIPVTLPHLGPSYSQGPSSSERLCVTAVATER